MTNFEMMMEKMMEQYMEKAMENMMAKMFSNMMGATEVANAEVETPTKKAPKTLSREDFLALKEDIPLYGEKKTSKKTSTRVELAVMENGLVIFDGYLAGDAWWYNHHKIITEYNAKSVKKGGVWGYTFNSIAERNACLAQFPVKQHSDLTEDDHLNCKLWREDKTWMKK